MERENVIGEESSKKFNNSSPMHVFPTFANMSD